MNKKSWKLKVRKGIWVKLILVGPIVNLKNMLDLLLYIFLGVGLLIIPPYNICYQ